MFLQLTGSAHDEPVIVNSDWIRSMYPDDPKLPAGATRIHCSGKDGAGATLVEQSVAQILGMLENGGDVVVPRVADRVNDRVLTWEESAVAKVQQIDDLQDDYSQADKILALREMAKIPGMVDEANRLASEWGLPLAIRFADAGAVRA